MAHQRLMLRAYFDIGQHNYPSRSNRRGSSAEHKTQLTTQDFRLDPYFFFGHYIFDLKFPHQTNH